MQTLHVSKDVRSKFSEHARLVVQSGATKTPAHDERIASEQHLRELLLLRQRGKPLPPPESCRFSIRPNRDLEKMMVEQLSYGLGVPTSRVVFCSGYWYPAKGYAEWRTGEENPGLHAQYIYAEQPSQSYMRLFEGQGCNTYYDSGFDLRYFKVPNPSNGEQRSWHSIYAGVNRVVIDYRII